MSIRRKLTFLLLFIALVPLVISRVVSARASLVTGNRLAEEMRQLLVDKAESSLLTMTKDFSRLLDAKEANIRLIVRFQAEVIEKMLADELLAQQSQTEKTPAATDKESSEVNTVTVLDRFGFDKNISRKESEAMTRFWQERVTVSPPKHPPLELSYRKQQCVVLESVEKNRFQLEALASMTQDYFELNQMARGAILRQYTILESGVMVSYPFEQLQKDQLAEDLREIPLYQKLKAHPQMGMIPSPPGIDSETGLTVIVVGMPLFYPDGRFAGMTGLDLVMKNWFNELELPQTDWQGEATAMLVRRLASGEIVVLEKQVGSQIDSTPDDIKEWRPENDLMGDRQIRLRYLNASDPRRLNQIVDQAEAGKSEIVRMRFNGKESIWAYGPARTGGEAQEPFLIVVVPEEKVIEQAVQKGDEIIRTARRESWNTGLFFLVVAVVTTLIGVRSAKVVTRPVNQIAEAGIRLSEGDYHAHVEIHTKDELQRLAEIFNETGPKLLEREKMMHSLAVASEIQQQLLPQEPPVCEGLDVAGQSRYCDETGGDYFDYLLLHGDGEETPRLGIAIGDVSGHGIGAALIMASIRSVLRSHAEAYQDRLADLMSLINRSLTDGTETGRFVTFCFSLFDPKQRTLRWVSAGHDPALYLHREEKGSGSLFRNKAPFGPFRQKAPGPFFSIDELPNSGLPLGVMDDPDYEAMGPLELQPGDVVLFGTDGIWETSDPAGNAFGKERLRQILLDTHDQSADAIREAVVQAVTAFRGNSPQLDDVTLVVVKVV